MRAEQIKKQLERFHWERWLERPLEAFMLSLFQKSITKEYMRNTGVDAEYRAAVFQDGVWYMSTEVHKAFRADIQKYIDFGGNILEVSHTCEKFWENSRERIAEMQSEPISKLPNNLNEFAHILNQINAYVWLTNGFEEIYTDLLHQMVPQHVKTDSADFIRRISYASKKNTHTQMEDALRSSRDLESIRKEFGWLKSRDGFTGGFTITELTEHRKRLEREKKQDITQPAIPLPLKRLTEEVQELIYFRTLRGDARLNLIFLMRSLLKRIARRHNISFSKLRFYSVYDLILDKPIYYHPGGTFLFFEGEMVYSKLPFVHEEKLKNTLIHGQTGCAGIARGKARIVTKTEDLAKVEDGDVFVAQTTFPAFIVGMRKAVAFVTNEGGITCHAAIIAREMKKPCIIGTKIATKVLKDGDMVEVDAEKGIVRIIKKSGGD